MKRRSEVLRELRAEIRSGKHPPGSRLPVRTDLERRFQASRKTLQHAMDALAREGYIRCNGMHGTYVCDALPHMEHYGLVMVQSPQESRFISALQQEAMNLSHRGPWRISVYVHHASLSSDGYRRLMDDVMGHRLSGLIFVHPNASLIDTPAWNEPGLQRVVIARNSMYGAPGLWVDSTHFMARSIELLVAQGRRRIACLYSTDPRTQWEGASQDLLGQGLSQRQWIQFADHRVPLAVEQLAYLMFSGEGGHRPDGLIITDDNLVEPATKAIAELGLRAPQDLDIVAHCNFPYPPPSHLLVRRLGTDCRALLVEGINLLNRQRAGESVPTVTALPQISEDQVKSLDNESNGQADDGSIISSPRASLTAADALAANG